MTKNRLHTFLTDYYAPLHLDSGLSASIMYSVQAGGKRLRPLIFLDLLEAMGLSISPSHLAVAAAIELIHTGSLIHDDLPSMDDDDFRRGKPTNHKVHGEAMAILAGDALFLDPFYLLATSGLKPEQIVQLVELTSFASGSQGMVAGQAQDIQNEDKQVDLDNLKLMHHLKTGRLLMLPFIAAGIVAELPDKAIQLLSMLGEHVGLAFQIRDDILDSTQSFETLGKTPGKDALHHKSTYVTLLGLNAAKTALKIELLAAKGAVVELTQLLSWDDHKLLAMIEGLDID